MNVVTNRESFESLSTNVKMITESNCLLNGVEGPCNVNGIDTMPSEGVEIHGAYYNVGEFQLKFGGNIGSSKVEIEYTREDAWNAKCDVELLKNGVVIDSVPENQGDSKGDRTKSTVMVSDGDVLTLREGADRTICGVHIYGIKTECGTF